VAWIYLLGAGLCEMAWPIGYKHTDGFTKNSWAILSTIAIMFCSFALLARAVREGIHIGTAYAVWTGIGAVGTALIGMALFKEPRDPLRLMCLGMIILGVIGLKWLSPVSVASTVS
jgi:quaternary ammonium compound-resistance protein SugE